MGMRSAGTHGNPQQYPRQPTEINRAHAASAPGRQAGSAVSMRAPSDSTSANCAIRRLILNLKRGQGVIGANRFPPFVHHRALAPPDGVVEDVLVHRRAVPGTAHPRNPVLSILWRRVMTKNNLVNHLGDGARSALGRCWHRRGREVAHDPLVHWSRALPSPCFPNWCAERRATAAELPSRSCSATPRCCCRPACWPAKRPPSPPLHRSPRIHPHARTPTRCGRVLYPSPV